MPILHLELERAAPADRVHANAQAADRVHGTRADRFRAPTSVDATDPPKQR
jgi:hypothetical protein